MAGKDTSLVLFVQVEEAHEQRHIRARVMRRDPENPKDLLNIDHFGAWSEPEAQRYNGLTISAYLGHSNYGTGSPEVDKGEIWGWGHFYAPDRIDRPEVARAMAGVLAKISKGLERLESETGRAATFSAYVTRIGTVLRLPVLVRNSRRAADMTGEKFRESDGSHLAYWCQDVAEDSRNGRLKTNMLVPGSSTDRI